MCPRFSIENIFLVLKKPRGMNLWDVKKYKTVGDTGMYMNRCCGKGLFRLDRFKFVCN